MPPARFGLETRGLDIGFLTLFVSRTPFKIWQNLGSFFKKIYLIATREILRFVEVNEHFWSLEAINYCHVYIHYSLES